jgi:hypothetical protein
MTEPILVGDGPRGNRRMFVLVGIAAAVLVGVVVLPGVLFGGGGSGSTQFNGALPHALGTGTSTTTAPGTVPETFEKFSRNNPFQPLVDTGPAAGTGGVTTGPGATSPPLTDLAGTSPGIGPTSPGSGSDGSSPPPPAATGAPTTTTVPPRRTDRVMLLEVFRDQSDRVVARVRVNDTSYQVGAGDDFDRSYRVVSLDIVRRCGSFLFGDERFDMCEGDEVRK